MEKSISVLIDHIEYELKRDLELQDVIKEGLVMVYNKIEEFKKDKEKFSNLRK